MRVHLRKTEVGGGRGLEGAEDFGGGNFSGAKVFEQLGGSGGRHPRNMAGSAGGVTPENCSPSGGRLLVCAAKADGCDS
jgi:hypothetical protein